MHISQNVNGIILENLCILSSREDEDVRGFSRLHYCTFNNIISISTEESEYFSHNFNPFVPNAPFFYPLKTSENCKSAKWIKKYEQNKIVTENLQMAVEYSSCCYY